MNFVFWLAYRELSVRKVSFLIGLMMCGLIVSMSVSVEWTLRSRESRVRQDIDQMGPPLIVIPPGRSMMDLRRFDLGPGYFNAHTFVEPLVAKISPHAHAVDSRLSIRLPVEGSELPVIGIDPVQIVSPHDQLRTLEKNQVALGEELSKRIGKHPGDFIRIGGSDFFIKAVLPSAGDQTDLAIFMPISQLWRLAVIRSGINEIRIFPKSDRHMDLIRDQLAIYGDSLHTIAIDRGELAETKISQSLAHHRYLIYIVLGMILSVSMMIWIYLDTKERRVELATVAAMGGSPATLIGLLSGRSAIVGAAGAILGTALSLVVKWVLDGAFPGDIIELSGLLAFTLCGAVFFSVVGAIPVAFRLATVNHSVFLQN